MMLRRGGSVVAWIIGLYFVGRAAVEPFVIDMSDPQTYARDQGGPGLAGVLAVHMGPGILAAALMIGALLRRRSRRRGASSAPTDPRPGAEPAGR